MARRRRPREWARWLQTPGRKARKKRERWERNWEVESKRPVSELATTLPKELVEAVESGWIPSGASVMDIGSGRGQISAWLADRGFTVLGIDLARAATDLARRHFSDAGPRLEFRTLNICLDDAEPGRFDAFVDRGCFQGVRELSAQYAEKVATWGKPGARLLLFHAVPYYGGSEHRTLEEAQEFVERRVRRDLGPRFEVERAVPTAEPMARSAGQIPRTVRPGMVFWLTQR
jgi:SAM-dependent methyltransferase